MEHGETVVISGGTTLLDSEGVQVARELITFEWWWVAVGRRGYDFFMVKDIMEEFFKRYAVR